MFTTKTPLNPISDSKKPLALALPNVIADKILRQAFNEKPSDFPAIASSCKTWHLAANRLRKQVQQKIGATNHLKMIKAHFFNALSQAKKSHPHIPIYHLVIRNACRLAPTYISELELLKNSYINLLLYNIYGHKTLQSIGNFVDDDFRMLFMGIEGNVMRAFYYLSLAAKELPDITEQVQFFKNLFLNEMAEQFMIAAKNEAQFDTPCGRFAKSLCDTYFYLDDNKGLIVSNSFLTKPISS